MNRYEIMFIVKPNLDAEALNKVAKMFEKIFSDNQATITLAKELGQKELAYDIKNHKSGYYYLYNIETADDKAIKEFDRIAGISEDVIRHLVINLDK